MQGNKAGIEFKSADYQATGQSLNNPAPHSLIYSFLSPAIEYNIIYKIFIYVNNEGV